MNFLITVHCEFIFIIEINHSGGIFKDQKSLGFGDLVTPDSICSAHGRSCSCVPKDLAHSIYEDEEEPTPIPYTTTSRFLSYFCR